MMTHDAYSDLESHHIEGYVAHSGEHVKIPLISEVLSGLWQGGCIDGVVLPDDFDYVYSLYPWERYKLGRNTSRIEVRAYDSSDVPDIEDVAFEVYRLWKNGNKILVHCQAGLNRSGLLCAQVLMMDGFSATDAIDLLRSNRSDQVLCNKFFVDHLLKISDHD